MHAAANYYGGRNDATPHDSSSYDSASAGHDSSSARFN